MRTRGRLGRSVRTLGGIFGKIVVGLIGFVSGGLFGTLQSAEQVLDVFRQFGLRGVLGRQAQGLTELLQKNDIAELRVDGLAHQSIL
jgi:hypothetical protein